MRILQYGSPLPLGATFTGQGTNFALFSDNADGVTLCLFSDDGSRETERIDLRECTNGVWHGYVPGILPGQVYAYRVRGSWAPLEGHRFNFNKLLLDPYARELVGAVRWDDALYGFTLSGQEDQDLHRDERDSAAFMPKARVIQPGAGVQLPKPQVRWPKTVIYEAHVRGLTMRHPLVPNDLRGTMEAIAHPVMIEHYQKIGVTAVELLPIHAYLQDRFLVEKNLTNYWGYSSLAYFAPEPRYLHTQDLEEIPRCVDRLHEAGIELILDVAYNHTCEGSHLGPTLSWKGIDNLSYYRSLSGEPRYYDDLTGCGNAVNTSHPRVLQMVMDSLRLWATHYGVDGFRFDLALTLGRRADGFSPDHAFFHSILQDPVLGASKLIAEPWDIGPGGYALGGFPPGFSEWNGGYRDVVRDFWCGAEGTLPDFARRFAASGDMFGTKRRRPWSSVNFITAHDGFTLHDLVTYNEKHNEANGENNRDGSDDNRSWNCGHEGETKVAAINLLRQRQKRNLLATLFLSQGVPMLLAGDEFGNSQGGNNNAYCQDNEIGWLDWHSSDENFLRFVGRLAKMRKDRSALSHPEFLTGAPKFSGQPDVAWFNANGQLMTEAQWKDPHNKCLTVRLAPVIAGDLPLMVLFNASFLDVPFGVPDTKEAHWYPVIDTADEGAAKAVVPGAALVMPHRSLRVFEAGAGEDNMEQKDMEHRKE